MALIKLNNQSLTAVSALPAGLDTGKVLQVVQGITTTLVESTSNTLVDTTLSASITPLSSSSKILIQVSHPNSDKRNGNGYMQMNLVRDSTVIYTPTPQHFFTNSSVTLSAGIAFSYLDSPSSSSSVTYKTMFRNGNGSDGRIRVQNNGNASTIILMEIAG